jgi:cytochrome c553
MVDSRVGCTSCHGADFGGGVVINVPMVGYWAAPNLTTGEGSITNGFSAQDWDHAVRHGVRHDGRSSSMPCEEFSNLSDHELSDIVAYIRSRPPVKRNVGHVKLGPVFAFVTATDPKALPAFVIDHQKPHAAEPPPEEPTAALGEHIVQLCRGCHGPNLSGGKIAGDPTMPIVANITPHESGLKGWTEADFVRALREGKRPNGTAIVDAMPWKTYGKMSDVELAAVWAYLKTVPPVSKGVR